jgi:protein-tyrosine kinase
MTAIERALELAKQMGKVRQRESTRDIPRVRATRVDATLVGEPRENFPALPVVEIDAQTCLRNHVLFTDSQLAAAGHAAPAYRLLRSRVMHVMKDISAPCIGVTSAGPGEGKSLTAINLAIHLARDKQNMVYLLDFDMRNPSVFKSFGARPIHELSEYLAGRLKPEEVLCGTQFENLALAGVGIPIQGASELLASPRLDELLAHIRRRSPHAFIVCDLPPVLSTDEALVVAPRTDGLLLVVSEGVTRRDGLARAVDILGDFTIAGICMNRSGEELGASYYSY